MLKKLNSLSTVTKLFRQFRYLFIVFLITFYPCFTQAQFVYNWFPSASGTTNHLYSVNGNLCVGAGGVILYTSNSGVNWSQQQSGTTLDLRSVMISGTAVVAGSNGMLLRSTNNGVNWVQIPSGTTNQLNSVARAYSSMYFAVGNSGTIIASTNSGLNWFSQQSPVSVNLNSVSGFGFNAWAVGNNGVLLTTSNSGTNWIMGYTGVNVNLKSVYFKDLNTGWIAGTAGLILKSTNGGINWFLQQSNTVNELNSVDGGNWICGNSGTVLRTTNYGTNWVPVPGITGVDLNSISLLSSESGFAVGNNGNIFVRRIDSSYLPYVSFTPNNIWTLFYNTGIFNQNTQTANTPGFQWPAGSQKFAVFTSGLTIAAKVNNNLRMSSASYKGEYYPGYVADSSGIPVGRNDYRFRFYKINRGDNASNSVDWLNWGLMVPFGAPYIDVNHNGMYEPAIDTPGVRGASQTLYICLTDGFPDKHLAGEGFGGGTLPLYAEVHLTAWGYDNPGYQDMQFIKWDIINKSTNPWNNTYFALFCDADLGFPEDDYIGCDTTRNLGYCYNADNDDGGTIYSYGANPPAVGFKMLNCLGNPALNMKSFVYMECTSCAPPPCESDPNGEPNGAYNMMKGVKKDGTPWVIPNTNPPQTTKYCYSGDPETNSGWTEFGGRIRNCDGLLTGQLQIPVPPGDRRLIMGTGSETFTVNPGDTQRVGITQLIARGSNNLNSVTLLKQLSDVAQSLCDSGFVIGVKQISSQFPGTFKLYQNYPNPFNPVTNIKYAVPYRTKVNIKIYDVNGREVSVLVNEVQNTGSYSVDWNAENFASGVYFYKLTISDAMNPFSILYTETKKMVLLK